jgi:hypothetical protein
MFLLRLNITKQIVSHMFHLSEKDKNSMEIRTITNKLLLKLGPTMQLQTFIIIATNHQIRKREILILIENKISLLLIGANNLDKNMQQIRKKEFIISLQMFHG